MAKMKLEIIEAGTKNLKLILTVSTHLLSNIHYSLFTFVHATFEFSLLGYSVYHFRNSPEEVAQVLFYMGLSVAVMVTSITGYVPTYRTRELVEDSYGTYDYKSLIMRIKLDEVKGQCAESLKGFFKTILFLIVWVISNLTGMTILVGLIKQEPIYIFPCWHPFDMKNIVFQILILLWQQYVMFTMIFMAFGGGSILFIPYTYIKSEVALLKYALEEIDSRAYEMARNSKFYNDDLDKSRVLSSCYMKCVKMCVEHHLEILRYFSNGKRMVGLSYSTAFCAGIIACTFGGYNINSDNLELKFKNLAILFFILGYLFVMFWIADATTNELLTIAETVFTMEWYNLPKECQSTLQLMLLMSNQPLFYTLLLGQKVDMEAYMALVKATYYYLNFLTA
ncbi:odorant receptor Or2-like [Halyomorpha halys]|uniref:odorant receptor Or2-like n=1 Tax=Halyomorpha halys TaxID=286706 RepID=UPI0034D2B541|nr:Odorant receptor 109 [Halyomorpha halys]